MPRKPETFRPPRRSDRYDAAARLYDKTRGSAALRGYGRRWRKVRNRKLAIDPLCEHCRATGQYVPAYDVDHIVPIREGGARYALSNLQSLCRRCHLRKHRSNDANRNADTGSG